MEMKVHCAHDEMVALRKLKPHPKNANAHPEDQIERLAEILSYQGWRSPIKVSKRSGFITAGHGRMLAAKFMGWTEAPVNYQDYESEDQEIADVHADNAIAAWAQLDFAKINDQLKDFDPEFNVDMLGIRSFQVDPIDLPQLPDGDRSALRQTAFQLTEEQTEQLERALEVSKSMGDFGDTGNSNSNGNAISRIAEIFLTQHGSSEGN